MARKTYSITPADGGTLAIGNVSSVAGPANYRAKVNIHRVQNVEEVVAGWGWFPGNLGEPVQMFVSVELLGGTREIVACCATSLYRWKEGSSEWSRIGGGYSIDGHRWECEIVANYAIFNNGVDLPFCYRAGDESVVPLYELRDQGVARVGCIGSKGGMLICGDISEIKAEYLDRWFVTGDSQQDENSGGGSIIGGGSSGGITSAWTNALAGLTRIASIKGILVAGAQDDDTGVVTFWTSVNYGKTWSSACDASGVIGPSDPTTPNEWGVSNASGDCLYIWSGVSDIFGTTNGLMFKRVQNLPGGRLKAYADWRGLSGNGGYLHSFDDCSHVFDNDGEVWIWLCSDRPHRFVAAMTSASGTMTPFWEVKSVIADRLTIRIGAASAHAYIPRLTASSPMAIRLRVESGVPRVWMSGAWSFFGQQEVPLSPDGAEPWPSPQELAATQYTGFYLGSYAPTAPIVIGRPVILPRLASFSEFYAWMVGQAGRTSPSGDLLSGMLFDGTQSPPASSDGNTFLSSSQTTFGVEAQNAALLLPWSVQGVYGNTADYYADGDVISEADGDRLAIAYLAESGLVLWLRSRHFMPEEGESIQTLGSPETSVDNLGVDQHGFTAFGGIFCRDVTRKTDHFIFYEAHTSYQHGEHGEQRKTTCNLNATPPAGLPWGGWSGFSWSTFGVSDVWDGSWIGATTHSGVAIFSSRINEGDSATLQTYRFCDGAFVTDATNIKADSDWLSLFVWNGRLCVSDYGTDNLQDGFYHIPLGNVLAIYGNSAASCPSGLLGDPIAANTYWAHTQAEADALAQSALVCAVYQWNDERTCGSGYVGWPVAAHQYMAATKSSANALADEHLSCVLYTGFKPDPYDHCRVAHIHPSTGDVWLLGSFTELYNVAEGERTYRGELARIASWGGLYETPYDPDPYSGTDLNYAVGYKRARSVVTQPGGKTVIFGQGMLYDGQRRNAIRLNSDGSVDNTFADLAYGDLAGSPDGYGIESAMCLPNGSIIVGGYFKKINGYPRRNLALLNSDGTLNTAWACDLAQGPHPEIHEFCHVHLIQAAGSGSFFVGGGFDKAGGYLRPGIARIFNDGTVDLSFTSPFDLHFDSGYIAGTVVEDDTDTLYGSIKSIIPVSDGYVISGDIADNYHASNPTKFPKVNIGCIKVGASGTRLAWNITNTGKVVNDGYGTNSWPAHYPAKLACLSADSDGKLYIAGDFTSIGGASVSDFARVTANGSLDAAFSSRPVFAGAELDPNFVRTGVSGVYPGGALFESSNYLYAVNSNIGSGVVGIAENVVAAAGGSGVAYVTDAGSLYACGSNTYGQLGNGMADEDVEHTDTIDPLTGDYYLTISGRAQLNQWLTTPAKVASAAAKVVSRIGFHFGYVSTTGGAWMCGHGSRGQLGTGTTPQRQKTFVQIASSGVNELATGNLHTAMLLTDGTLKMFGANDNYQLGDGTNVDKTSPTTVMSNVSKVACSNDCTAIVKSDGSLWVAGWLGYDSPHWQAWTQIVASGVVDVSCGAWFVAFTKTDGSLWVFGSNPYATDAKTSIFGSATNGHSYTPIEVATEGVAAVEGQGGSVAYLTTGGDLCALGSSAFKSQPFYKAPQEVVTGMATQPDGKRIITGNFSSVNGVNRSNLARFTPQWVVD